jgi:hypothetical protein
MECSLLSALLLTLALLLGWAVSRLGAPECAHLSRDAISNASLRDPALLRAALGSLGLGVGDAEYYTRSLVVPGDPRAAGQAISRARASGKLTISILGGSTSAGGGHTLCGTRIFACGSACCGPGYHDNLVQWLRDELGVETTVHNAAVGATGPELPSMCIRSMLEPEHLASSDLVLLEYAINSGGRSCLRQVDRLLWRLRRLAPSAAIVMVHTYTLARFIDGSEECLNQIARQYQLPAVSWKEAVFPLFSAARLAPRELLEPPIWHHPNVEGHRHLASILAHFLLQAHARYLELSSRPAGSSSARDGAAGSLPPVVREPAAPTPSLAAVSPTAHERILSAPFPTCLFPGSARIASALLSNRGWEENPRKRLYSTAQPGATIAFRVHCERDGCGVRVGLTQSYQPLGMLDVLVDGIKVVEYSEVAPGWRERGRLETINRFVTVVNPSSTSEPAPVRAGNDRPRAGLPPRRRLRGPRVTPLHLRAGEHTVAFRCRGETEPAARSYPTNYRKHEVQLRSVAVFYDREDDLS